jgi:hypothetical protein
LETDSNCTEPDALPACAQAEAIRS